MWITGQVKKEKKEFVEKTHILCEKEKIRSIPVEKVDLHKEIHSLSQKALLIRLWIMWITIAVENFLQYLQRLLPP